MSPSQPFRSPTKTKSSPADLNLRRTSSQPTMTSSKSLLKHAKQNTSSKRARLCDADSVDSSSSRGASTSSSITGRRHIERILDKKFYQGQQYYKLKLVDSENPVWDLSSNIDDFLIEQYENTCHLEGKDEDEDEWEVEQIIDKRIVKGEVQYLVKWKGWPGGPTWESAEKCNCINLIAVFENPRFRKLWDFQGSNQALWLSRRRMIKYMKEYIERRKLEINLLNFKSDLPTHDQPPRLEDGLNIGPLKYANHWYLIIILINCIGVTRRILIGDSLNTLIGSHTKTHPVHKRISSLYKGYPIKTIRLTPMDRSDVCAFYTLAAFERALFLLDAKAQIIVESIYFDATRAEMIRSQLKPETDGEISVALPIPDEYSQGPTCEFCGEIYDTRKFLDLHITKTHIKKDTATRYTPKTCLAKRKSIP